MKIYNNIADFKTIKNGIITIGTFDGVHKGHEIIINRLNTLAKEKNGESILLTFFPHPRMVLYPDDTNLKLINTIDERIEMLEKLGVDHIIVHPFSKEFSRLSSLEFVRDVLVNKIGVSTLVIGYDHHFGRNREGSFDQLKEYASLYEFDVEEIPAQEFMDVNISSSKIRNFLLEGNINAANDFLGYPYFLKGTVVGGDEIGRKIGFPTANIKVDEWYKLIPANGVYAIKAIIDNQQFEGMLNIGKRPTLNGKGETIEVNIFEFNESIYGKEVRIAFYDRLRGEKKFDELEDLKKQLKIDKEKTIQLFS